MIALLPIARYKVEYQVASGRPFSTFEKLLLRAINEGNGTLGRLSEVFRVHRRIVIEGLVTLMQAGWVSMVVGSDEFVLTRSGQLACEGSSGLPPTIVVSDRSQTIVVEKVTGQLARNGEVDYYTRSKLKDLWDSGVSIRRQDVSNIVDPGMVAPLLPHQSTEWIRWIGPISVLSDNAAFAVVDVDTSNGRITGLPKSWEPLLLSELLDQVSRRESDLASAGVSVDDNELRQLVRGAGEALEGEILDDELSWQPLSLQSGDLLISNEDDVRGRRDLFTNAQSHVAVALSQVSPEVTALLIPQLLDALNRGLAVSVLIGDVPTKEAVGPRGALESLRKIEYDSGRGTYPGRLTLSGQSTGCVTNIMVADTPDGAGAILGVPVSASEASGGRNRGFSIVLRDAWIVGHLCEILADLSAADEKLRLGSGFVRLKKAAGDLRSRLHITDSGQPLGGGVRARLLLDRDQETAIREAIGGTKQSIVLSTGDLAKLSAFGVLKLLVEPSERIGPEIKVQYGSPVESEAGSIPLTEILQKNGVQFAFSRGQSADCLLGDDDCLVAFSPAGRARNRRRPYASSIGIAMRGGERLALEYYRASS